MLHLPLPQPDVGSSRCSSTRAGG